MLESSHDQEPAQPDWASAEAWLKRARERGAERAVITGGGEPTLLPQASLRRLLQVCRSAFDKVVLITNGHLLATKGSVEANLAALYNAGLSVLAISRHHHDPVRNCEIMQLDTHAENLTDAWDKNRSRWPNIRLRLICVLQAGGVEDESTLAEYLNWTVMRGVEEICFKELYVSTSIESVYHDRAANEWSRQHQVPLSLVTEFAERHGFTIESRLPWGAPIYRGEWQGRRFAHRCLHRAKLDLGTHTRRRTQLECHGRWALLCFSRRPRERNHVGGSSVNFAAFQRWRQLCLAAQPGLLDCGETNLYRSLASLQLRPDASTASRRVHRCDLARAWLDRYGFPEHWSRQALVNRGVRHALSLIFRELARTSDVLWIPTDVYPTYAELARAAGIGPRFFSTLPEPPLLPTGPARGPEFLLIANPWKPLGRFLDRDECAALVQWIEVSPGRRVLIDAVYDLGTPFHESTVKLLETGRAILLHSVTKGWLWPKTFGVALLTQPWPKLESAFRSDPPAPEQLQFAEQLLLRAPQSPSQVSAALAKRKRNLLMTLPRAVSASLQLDSDLFAPGCYLFPVAIPSDELLMQHRILAVPVTAFGSDWNGSVITSLSAHFANGSP